MDIPRASRGLSVLMGSVNSEGRLVQLPLRDVERNERQPRQLFDDDAIASLAASIESKGVIQPIAVREAAPGKFEIIAGERRWLASQRAGRDTIPAVVHDVDDDDALVLALVENVVREDLTTLETARAYSRLVDECGMSITAVADSVGKSRPAVSNTLRILELPDDVLELVDSGALSEGHARVILQLDSRVDQLRFARQAADQGMSVRALEVAVRNWESAGSTTVDRPGIAPELQERAEDALSRAFGVHAKVSGTAKHVRLEVQCTSFDELDTVLQAIEGMAQRPAAATA